MAGILPITDSRDTSRSKASTERELQREQHPLPFLQKDTFSDTILDVEGQKIYIHRALLGSASPDHFAKILNAAHDAAKEAGKSKAEIKIADKNFAVFVDLFSFIHPAVCKELTDKMALKLLPLAHEYKMMAVKERCEKLLVSTVKKLHASIGPKGTTKNRNLQNDKFLLDILTAGEQGKSNSVRDQCIKIYSSLDIADAKTIKSINSISGITPETKSKIYESRMNAASTKLAKMANDLDKEKHEKEMLKKQVSDRYNAKKSQTPRYSTEPTVEKQSTIQVTGPQYNQFYTSRRYHKVAETILGPVHEYSHNDYRMSNMSNRISSRVERGDS